MIMDKYLNKLDLNSLFNLVISEADYDEMVTIDNSRGNLLDDPLYKQNDDILKSNYEKAKANGMIGEFSEQSNKGNTFRHIAVNRKFNGGNHLRLYLCPEDHNLYQIVNELLKRSLHKNIPIYLKYSRENRYDKLLIFLKNPQELLTITNLLEEIKSDNPSWFTNMKKSATWLSESKFKDAYIAPEKITKRDYNVEYPSYTKAVQAMLINIKNELFFEFQVNSMEELKKNSKQDVFNAFCCYFEREIGKMGLYLFYNENDELLVYVNSLFPGFGKSTDEDILLTKNGLEIGKRIDISNKRYYKIPFGESLPTNASEYKKFEYYDANDVIMKNKRFYPSLYSDDFGTNSSGFNR